MINFYKKVIQRLTSQVDDMESIELMMILVFSSLVFAFVLIPIAILLS